MNRCLFTVIAVLLLSKWAVAQNKIVLVQVASGFDTPVGIAHAGDDRLFIIEKDGYIRIMDTSGQVQPQPFLDIDARVNSGAFERGLLGLAFHPAYAQNGYFFVNYTNTAGNTVVSRFSRDAGDPNLADPASEMIVITQTQPFTNHNGGHVVFGPDGYMYVGLGDGGSAGDPDNRAQDLQLLLGKILRFNVDGDSLNAVPPDNPFIENDTIRPEIWAFGLRNPWRFSFDRMTGDLWIADVGQDSWEEIDFQPADSQGGENYGWRCKEGLQNFDMSECPPGQVFVDPVYVYAHAGGGCAASVTGGHVYRGTRNPYLFGKYVFTDYCTGVFRAILRQDDGTTEAEELANLQNQQFTSFGEDASGELYVAAANGIIYRVQDLISSVSDVHAYEAALMPNPASEVFMIKDDVAGTFEFEIYDINGQSVLAGRTSSGGLISCDRIGNGIYIIKWQTDGMIKAGKLAVVK